MPKKHLDAKALLRAAGMHVNKKVITSSEGKQYKVYMIKLSKAALRDRQDSI